MPTLREMIYADCIGLLDLRAIAKGKPPKREVFLLEDEVGIKNFIKENVKNYDLYFGVATRDANGGKKENIVEIPGLWVDIDYKDIDPKEADRRLSEFPFKPTLIINSGGGLHVYWIFKEPSTKEEMDLCEATMSGMVVRLGGDKQAAEAARILRIPGTLNHKYKPPREVSLRYHNGSRYNLSDFSDLVLDSSANSPVPSVRSTENLDAIMTCKFLQHCRDDAKTLKEPEWYAMMSILAREPGGIALIHQFSKPYKKYSKSETTEKIMHALDSSGPATCDSIRVRCEFDCGQQCPVKSPAVLPFKLVTGVTGVTNETFVPQCHQMSPDVTRMSPGTTKQPEERNVMQEVKDWLETCDGVFTLKNIADEFRALAGSLLYTNIKQILKRLISNNSIERVGATRGVYRRVEDQLETMNWWDASNEELPFNLPLGVGTLTKLMPKSIIVIAGEQNSSKSAIALNIAKDNCNTFITHYFNSEMSNEELRERILKFDDVEPGHFRKINFYPRTDNFQDVIFPDDLNIIDFLEIHDDFWKIGGVFRAIYDKLNQGIAVVNIQKAPGKDWGRGGTMSIEKARLYLAVSTLFDKGGKPYNQAKIVKAKLYRNHDRNPNGMVRDFRVYGGAKLMPLSDWEHPKK
jgi:hypothetical protein